MKYEKMEKSRKAQVQIYKGGHKDLYKGETSGIKTGLVRAIKM